MLFVRDYSNLCIVGNVGEDPHCIAQLPHGLTILNIKNNVSPGMKPLFSPDDTKVLFIAVPSGNGGFGSDDPKQHAYVVNADGTGLRQLAKASVDQATWINQTSVALYLHSGGLLKLNLTNGQVSRLGSSQAERDLLWDTISGQHLGGYSCFDYYGIVCRDLRTERLQRIRFG